VPTNNLDVCRLYHKWGIPGTRRYARLWCIYVFVPPHAMTAQWNVPLRLPGFRSVHTPLWRAAVRCDRVTTVQLEGPLEVVDSLAGMRIMPMRMAVHPSRVVPVRITARLPVAEACWGRCTYKRTIVPRQAALRREQLGNSSVRPHPWGMKAVCCRDWKEKHRGQHDFQVLFTKVVTDVTGTSSRRGNVRVRTSSLKEKQCDMTVEIWNGVIIRGSVAVNMFLQQWINTQQ
jgi:hypothetical protein